MTPELNHSTALTLRAGIALGMVLMVAGLVMYFLNGSEALLYVGVLVLVVSPFIGVIVSFAVLVMERDRRWAGVAALLLVITAVGMALSV